MDNNGNIQASKAASKSDSGNVRGSGSPEPHAIKRAATDDAGAVMAADGGQRPKILKKSASDSLRSDAPRTTSQAPQTFASSRTGKPPHSEPSSSKRCQPAVADDDDDDDEDEWQEAPSRREKRAKRILRNDSNSAMLAKTAGIPTPVYASLLRNLTVSLTSKSKERAKASMTFVCPLRGDNGCKSSSYDSAAQFLTHLRSTHADKGTLLLEQLAADKLPLEHCACNQLFPKNSLKKHQRACASAKQSQVTKQAAPNAAAPAADAVLQGAGNWLANVPWDQLDEGWLKAVAQPGVKTYHGFKGLSFYKRVAKMLVQLHSHEEGGATPARRWIGIHVLSTLMLFVPSGVELTADDRKQLQKRRLNLLQLGQWATLVDELRATAKARRDGLLSDATRDGISAVEAKIARGKVAEALEKPAKPVVLTTAEVEAQLKPKHFPPLNAYQGAANHNYTSVQLPDIQEADLKRALSDDKTRDCFGLTVCYWKQMFQIQPQLVLALVKSITRNAVPTVVKQYIGSVNYTVLSYQDTGKLRAVGSVSALLKVAQNVLLKNVAIRKKMEQYFKTTPELAVGAKHGTTAGSLKVAAKIEKARAEQQGFDRLAVCALDLRSAYTNASRAVIREQLENKFPSFLPLFDLMYDSPSCHRVLSRDGDVVDLVQNDGVIQGSETSTFFFVMLTMAVLSDDLDHWQAVMTKFSDDMVLVADVDTVKQDFNKLKDGFANIGLELSLEKCKLFMPGGTEVECQQHAAELGVTAIKPDEGLVVLGVPVGDDAWVEAELARKADDFEEKLNRVRDSISTQSLLLVLQSAQSMFQHVVAAVKPALVEDLCQRVDTACRAAFVDRVFKAKAHLLEEEAKDRRGQVIQYQNKAVTYRSLLQMRLEMPVKKGGLGVLSLVTRSKRAYLISTSKLKLDHEAVWDDFAASSLRDGYQAVLGELGWANKTVKSVAGMDISSACGVVYKEFDTLLRSVGNASMVAAYCASRQRGAGTFLTMRPVDKQRTLANEQAEFAILQRMGIMSERVLGIVGGSECGYCGKAMSMAHVTSCSHFRSKRHDAIRDVLRNMVCSAGIGCQTEQQAVSSQQRVDLWTSNYTNPEMRPEKSWLGGDVTVVSPVDNHSKFNAKALERAAKDKTTKYTTGQNNFSEEMHAVIVPLAMSTFGALESNFHSFIAKTASLAIRTNRYMPGVDEYFIPKWKQIVAATLIRAQAAAARSVIVSASTGAVAVGLGADVED